MGKQNKIEFSLWWWAISPVIQRPRIQVAIVKESTLFPPVWNNNPEHLVGRMRLVYFQGKVMDGNGQHWCISEAVREVVQTSQSGKWWWWWWWWGWGWWGGLWEYLGEEEKPTAGMTAKWELPHCGKVLHPLQARVEDPPTLTWEQPGALQTNGLSCSKFILDSS